MSYNLVDPSTGDLTQVAGNGKAEYGASTIRKGIATIPSTAANRYTITFDTPMPDADYILSWQITGCVDTDKDKVIGEVAKTANDFTLWVFAPLTADVVFTYTAFKLYSDVEYSNIVNSMPSNASASNKLVAKSDTAKRKDVTVTATASIENDIKTLLDELIAETSGVYIGSFTRTGNTSGYYSVSVNSTWNTVGIVSICGATSAAYRVAKFKSTEQGAYTYLTEKLITENEAILRHSISIPVESGTTFYDVWGALQYQLIHTDWTFLTSSDWNSASGGYELQGYYWGEYCATHTTDNNVVITGTITWGAKPHTFSAYHDPTVPAWKININGEELMYNADNITVAKDISTGRRIFVRNTGNTNIGALYNALQACDLLNRPSTGIFNWTIQQARTCNLGTPYDANHWTNPVAAGELAYFQNPRVSAINSANSEWWLFWSDGNVYGSCNMWGETNPLCTYIALEYII